jgi:hypothetical protein
MLWRHRCTAAWAAAETMRTGYREMPPTPALAGVMEARTRRDCLVRVQDPFARRVLADQAALKF